ncbi:hypothetical protein MNBD_GAMMA09-2161 [hydrothermal vent metagenome]|uniref:Uncharacterized protein n=1 Tax=hydrothermal vent metagenome TaxID=652676 RepID=A0A3B0XSF0_9ZZZZ
MKKIINACVIAAAIGSTSSVFAKNDILSMVGTWKWEGFTIKVDKCDATEVCAEVISGPKNVGMQMIKSKLKSVDGNFVGKVAHPQTGDTYNSKLSVNDSNSWHIDGCTDANVCASGDFTRVK